MKFKAILFFNLIILTFVCVKARSQYVFIPDNTGKQLSEARYENVTGSPYFFDSWLAGEAKLSKGQVVKVQELKYDLVKDRLIYKVDDKIFEFFPLCTSFTLYSTDGNKTFLLRASETEAPAYYQLLHEGPIQFLKKTTKTILEAKGYNSATLEKVVNENKKYFINFMGSTTEVKLNKKSFLSVLPSFKDKIESYFLDTSKKINEQNFVELISLLNKP
jgi:hypothetical protein